MNSCWMSILVQVMEPEPQPRVKGIMVGSSLDEETGQPMAPRFASQLYALQFWMEHKDKFEVAAPYTIVRGSAVQEVLSDYRNDYELVEHLDDEMEKRQWVRPKKEHFLLVDELGEATWKR